jgi:hypothetical protein
MLNGRKLALTLVFTVLVVVAFGVSCRGFFPKPVLQSIAISPTAPQVDVGKTENLQVFGTYDDGTRKVVTSGVTWTSDATDVATIDANTGLLTGVSPGKAGIGASAEALPASATATVILTGVTQITVTPTTGNAVILGTGVTFEFDAFSGTTKVPITSDSGGILTITPSDTFITCSVSGIDEVCSAVTGAVGPYQIKMTYPGTSFFATATLTVSH